MGQAIGGVAAPLSAERSFALEVILTDDAGAPIPYAAVILHGSSLWEGRTVFTHDEGRLTFTGLQAGEYQVVASASGFVSTSYEDFFMGPETVRIALRHVSQTEKRPLAKNVSVHDLAAPPKAKAEYRKGLGNMDKRQYDEGRRAFQAAVRIYPAYAAAYAGLGISLLQLHDREEALKALRMALELNPSSYDAQLCTGLILNDQRRFHEARKYLDVAARLNSTDWRVHYELGRMHYGLSQFTEAEESLRLARRARPRYGNLYLLLANTLALEEKHDEAITEFEKFLEIAPASSAAAEVREKLRLLRAEVQNR